MLICFQTADDKVGSAAAIMTGSIGDAQTVQFASAGLILSGLAITVGAMMLFPLRTSMSSITSQNQVPWSPRDFGGKGSPGRSPVYGVAWTTIYVGLAAYSFALLIAAAQRSNVDTDAARMFNSSACVFAALLTSSLWTPLFAERKRWTFVLAAAVLVFTAIVTMTGAIVAKPFFSEHWWDNFGGAVTSIFAGWTTVAAALSVGIVTRIYNRGLDKGKANEEEKSFFPFVLSVLLSALAITFANPLLPLPLFLALFFVKGIFLKDWRIWSASLVCAAGMIGAGVTLGVTEAPYW